MIIASWIFGILGIVCNFLIYQQPTRRRLLSVKLSADTVWTLHYLSLFAFSGAGVCAIGILRETVFLNEKRKWAQGKRWLLLFLLLSILSAILTWKNNFSILPTLASALSVFSFWKGDPHLTRLLSFPISACFLTYNISCGSYLGILNEIIVLSATVIALVRLEIKKG